MCRACAAMKLLAAICLAVLAEAALAAVVVPRAAGDDDDLYRLPPNFMIGAGISATQAEGAWNVSGESRGSALCGILTLRMKQS